MGHRSGRQLGWAGRLERSPSVGQVGRAGRFRVGKGWPFCPGLSSVDSASAGGFGQTAPSWSKKTD